MHSTIEMTFMKGTILSILIILSIVNSIDVLAMDENNNNNNCSNNNNVTIKCPELPPEKWAEIADILINKEKIKEKIKEANNLLELKDAVKGLYPLLLMSKVHNEIAKERINKKFKLDGKEIILKDFYIQRKNEIIREIKKILEAKFKKSFDSFEWFNHINSKDSFGNTALMIATIMRNKDVAELLIQNGANLNAQDKRGNTALIMAVMADDNLLAELLIKNGADLDVQDDVGNMALMFAIFSNNIKIVTLLIQSGAKLNLQDSEKNTALMIAIANDYNEIAELLIQNRADLNIQNEYGNTALMIASMKNNKNVAELLIKNGAGLNFQNFDDKTALTIAIFKNNKELAEIN